MGSSDLAGRLGALPGVATCTVTGETVALLAHPDVDARLLRARAQVLCAEAGERRPLIVVGGLSHPAGASTVGTGAARRFMSVAHRRAIVPVGVAVASLFVLSLVAAVPVDETRRSGPRRVAAPAGVVFAPPSTARSESATALPPVPASPAPNAGPVDPGSGVVEARQGQDAALTSPGAPTAGTASSPAATPPAATVLPVSARPSAQSAAIANSTPVEAPALTARSSALAPAADAAPLATTSADTEQRLASRRATSLDVADSRVDHGDGAKGHPAKANDGRKKGRD